MPFLRFIVRNVLRNKKRTALTVLSTGFSLFLLIVLRTFLDLLYNPPLDDDSAQRLAVLRSTSIAEMMPFSYLARLETVPHVRIAMPFQWFGGYYKEPKNFFGNFATDPVHMWDMFTELKVSEETKIAFRKEKMAAVAGEDLMKRFGWKIGDHITLKGTIFPADPELKIIGAYHHRLDNGNLYFRMDYLDDLLGNPGEVGAFWLKADSAEAVPGVAVAVDAMFRNSPAETKTETEKSFVLNFVSMLGNVRMLMGSIGLVVVFTMLLVAASTMAMTIRERRREIAILKAIGYPQGTVFGLILGEAVFLALMGAFMGCVFAKGLSLCDLYSMTGGFIAAFPIGVSTLGLAAGAAAAIGLISGAFPAWRASRMTVSQAMRELEA